MNNWLGAIKSGWTPVDCLDKCLLFFTMLHCSYFFQGHYNFLKSHLSILSFLSMFPSLKIARSNNFSLVHRLFTSSVHPQSSWLLVDQACSHFGLGNCSSCSLWCCCNCVQIAKFSFFLYFLLYFHLHYICSLLRRSFLYFFSLGLFMSSKFWGIRRIYRSPSSDHWGGVQLGVV